MARELVQRMLAKAAADKPWLLNVNIPNLPYADLKPFKVCRLGRRHAAEKVISQTSPHGETMYWIGGAGPAKDDADGTDFHATTQGHVSITPLKVDLTDHDELASWARGRQSAECRAAPAFRRGWHRLLPRHAKPVRSPCPRPCPAASASTRRRCARAWCKNSPPRA